MFPETLTYLIYKFIVIYRLQFFEYFQFSTRFEFYVPPFMYNIKSNKQTTQVTVFETSKRCLSCVMHGCCALVCMCKALRTLYTFIPVSTNSLLHYLVSIQTCLTICVVIVLPSVYRKYFILVIPIIRIPVYRSLHIFTYHQMEYGELFQIINFTA